MLHFKDCIYISSVTLETIASNTPVNPKGSCYLWQLSADRRMKAGRESLENRHNVIKCCMQEKIINIVINSVIHS